MRQALALLLLMGISACATERTANQFDSKFNQGDLDGAYSALKSPNAENVKNEFLYLVNKGVLLSKMKRLEESNDVFERAYVFGEDVYIRYVDRRRCRRADSITKIYHGEYHEHLMVLYYKIMNYLEMGKPEEALVECRRLIIRQQQFACHRTAVDQLEEDSFFQILIGIVFEINNDYWNAFTAYRAAVEVHKRNEKGKFGSDVPLQLRKDLLRMASLSGQFDEICKYKKEFDLPENFCPAEKGAELILFWNTGRCPVRGEWVTNFNTAIEYKSVAISSRNLGLNLGFRLDDFMDYFVRENDITKIRIKMPRYLEWPCHYSSASVKTDDGTVSDFELLEDVHRLAAKCLLEKSRYQLNKMDFSWSIGWTLMNEQNGKSPKEINHALGVFDMPADHVDNRCWETLPHSIYYCRVPLREGGNTIAVNLSDQQNTIQQRYSYSVAREQIVFQSIHSMEWNEAVY